MDWFEVNHMKANASKFQSISIGTNKNYECKVKVKGTEINECNSCVKLVGVYIHKLLDFNKHILEICIKAGRQLNVLKRLYSKLNVECRLNISRCFVLSHFNYCPIVWHFCGQQNT